MRAILYITTLLITIYLVSCGDYEVDAFNIDAKPIDTYLEGEDLKNIPYLKIKNSAFYRDFLLYGTFIPMLNSSTGHSLKGRVVRFEPLGDRVVMLESPKGHSIADEKESIILLAEFPIVQTDKDGLVIDFAQGMNSVFTMRNVHSRSLSETDSDTSEQFRAIVLSASFVNAIKAEDDVLSISQIAQWRNQQSELISAEFRYFFREYLPSPTFKKVTFGKHRWVQYFSTPPMVRTPTTEPMAYIAKWDIAHPIVFHLSSDTPKEYKDAIKDGLLFWNHIFGKNIIEVRDLEKGIKAPHPRINIIQWVIWDNEASAYADMVVDPLTGETLQAQIYLRSGWVIQSARKLRSQLEEILLTEDQTLDGKATDEEEDLPLPAMFDFENPCQKTLANFDELSDLVTGLSITDISDETLTVLTGDILRAVIAHEMGHVFGLRHNLAGSTFGNISLNERSTYLKRYLQSGHNELGSDSYLTTSIMDVLSAADDAIVGAQIREILKNEAPSSSSLQNVYTYDKQAIDYGYFSKPMLRNVAFCTDDDIPRYLDCRRWDISNSPAQFASSRVNSMMTQISLVLADTFAQAIDPERKGGPLSVTDIPLSTQNALKVLDQHAKELFLWFNQRARSVQIETNFAAFGAANQADITSARFKSLEDQINENGVEQTLFALLPPFRADNLMPNALMQSFNSHFSKRLRELENTRSGFVFSDGERKEAQKIAESFFKNLNTDVIRLITSIVGRAQFDDPDFQLPIEEAIGKIANELVLKNNKISASEKSDALPIFAYDLVTRDLGAQLLSPALGLLPDWSFDNLTKVINSLKQLMRRYGATDGNSTVDLGSLSRDRRQWLLEQNRILNTLLHARTTTRALNQPTIKKANNRASDSLE